MNLKIHFSVLHYARALFRMRPALFWRMEAHSDLPAPIVGVRFVSTTANLAVRQHFLQTKPSSIELRWFTSCERLAGEFKWPRCVQSSEIIEIRRIQWHCHNGRAYRTHRRQLMKRLLFRSAVLLPGRRASGRAQQNKKENKQFKSGRKLTQL